MHKLKARASAWLSLLALPLLLAPLMFLDGDGGGDGGDPPEGDPPEGDPPKSFSQADVDRIVAERVKRVKLTAPADYDDLKAKATKLDEIEAASRSDLEKAQEAQRRADERATAAEARANETARRHAIEREASKQKAADPDDIFAVLQTTPKYRDMVTMDDDGQVTGVDEAVKAILADKPHLVGKTSTPAGDGDGGSRGGGEAQKPKTLEDAVSRALTKTG
jgi:hypothetical protein